MDNLHYYYNVKYLEDASSLSDSIIKAINSNNKDEEKRSKKIAKNKVQSLNGELLKKINSNDTLEASKTLANRLKGTKIFSTFKLKTTYPGLLFGIGYPHTVEKKVSGEQLQNGFYFDYTSGVPYYPGSSLKGVISHVLKKAQYLKEEKNDTGLEAFLCENNDKLNLDNLIEATKNDDVFVGAYIVGLYDENNRIMDIDYITPHKNELSNPMPIPFIRINPDVVLEFFFIVDKEHKDRLDVYKKIIMEFGIGAKTNVGYGRMTTYDETKLKDKVIDQ